jgi:hypothetical protein
MKITTVAIVAAAMALPEAAYAVQFAYKADCSTVDKKVTFIAAIAQAELKL